MMKRFLLFVSVLAFCMPTFVINTNAAGTIPRDGLRMELLLATGSTDTSGNGRIVSSTGIAPSYQIDPIYGIPYAQFNGSGGLTTNTAWDVSGSADFAISFWMKLQPQSMSGNSIRNFTMPTSTIYMSNNYLEANASYFMYDTPLVIFSSKTTAGDTNNMRLAITKDGKCSFTSKPLVAYLSYVVGPSGNKPTAYMNDIFSSFDTSYTCFSSMDTKWHHLVLNRKSGTMTLYVDGLSVLNVAYAGMLQRILNIGLMGTSMDAATYSAYPTNIKNNIWNGHFFKGGLAGYRIYSRALGDNEIESLMDEYRYAQSELAGAGDIQVRMDRYSKPMLYANFSNIQGNLDKDTVHYEYSIGSGSFAPVTSITQTGNASGTLSYNIGVDLLGQVDGRITVTFRVRSDDQSYQNIGTVAFTKLDNQVDIIINQPTSDITLDKTITATTTGSGQLFMIQTQGYTCDSSITTWENYSDLTFAGKGDNGIRVCYKAVFSSINKTIYKLSAAIQGIQPIDTSAIGSTSSLFGNYTLWVKSLYMKASDSASMILELLTSKQRTNSYIGASVTVQSYSTTAGSILTLTDINGDGLVDFLYSTTDPVRRAIIINNGNFTFRVVYKCAIDGTSPNYTYYGDCADTTR